LLRIANGVYIMLEYYRSIMDQMRELYLQDRRPILVGFSGGKDSSFMLTLLWRMLESLEPSQRQKPIHLLSADTLVEAPHFAEYLYRSLQTIERQAQKQGIPICVHLVQPEMNKRLLYYLLGRGNNLPTGNVRYRFCTSHVKIEPMEKAIRSILKSEAAAIAEQHVGTLWLAVRNEESARRRASIGKHEESAQSLFAQHSSIPELRVFHPIKFVTGDEIFLTLGSLERLPYGVETQELFSHYGADVMECGLKTGEGEKGSSCGAGNNRTGCWLCGLSRYEDPMLLRYIEEGRSGYDYLLRWKQTMLDIRNDIRYREVLRRPILQKKLKQEPKDDDLFTMSADYYDSYRRVEYEVYEPGGLTQEGRRLLLEYLLYIQEETGFSLIAEEEIQAILEAWEELDGIQVARHDLIPRPFAYDGPLVFRKDKTVNEKETRTPNPIFYVTIDLGMEEQTLYAHLRERQRVMQKSLFFFPQAQDFEEERVVWNSATFVVCHPDIETQAEANAYVYRWLGWEYGMFTEQTKRYAINYLILSALREGVTTRPKPLSLLESKEGQLEFVLA
jgi:DNA sulfur modification protein DndC